MIRRILLATVLLTCSAASQAWELQYYAGFGMGKGFFSKSGSEIETSLQRKDWTDPKASIADSSTVWKAYYGVYFSPYLGAQIGYANLGNTDLKASASVPPGQEEQFAADLASIEPDLGKGAQISIVGRFPVFENFVIHDWLGVFMWKNDTTVTVNDVSVKESTSGSNFVLGAAIEYQLNYELGLRLEIERFNQQGDAVNVLGAGIAYYF